MDHNLVRKTKKTKKWRNKNKYGKKKLKQDLSILIRKVISAANESPEDLPSLMTQNIEVVFSMQGYEGVQFLEEFIAEAESGADEFELESLTEACDYILSFSEEFVEQARVMDEENKKLIGKIIRSMTKGSETVREENLDKVLEDEKDNFTPGFLRHIEGECDRIAAAPNMTPESSKMLQTLRTIQLRVVEELGADLGEAALVLGQGKAWNIQFNNIA